MGESGLLIKAVSLPSRDAVLRIDAERPLQEPCATLILRMRQGEACFFVESSTGDAEPIGVPVVAQDAAWTGARIGLLSLNPGTRPNGGRASFENFLYRPVRPDHPV
jgi:hypothetical protein